MINIGKIKNKYHPSCSKMISYDKVIEIVKEVL
jgi:hypothetical protein